MIKPSPHQLEQLAIATSARVGILTGSAGTGKSLTVAHYLSTLPKGTYSVCAPTGKAATRLNAELQCGASTIHSLLRVGRNGHDGDGWSFFYNQSNPLRCKTLVVDECFMISVDTFTELLRAVSPGTQVLLVGDPNQLPPVGHGRPVFDMLNSGVIPHGHLSEVWRYAGRIATVANAIKDGKPWRCSPKIDLESQPPENYFHLDCSTPQAILAKIPRIMESLKEKRGFDPFEDLQVICWVNDKGPCSRKHLNAQLQQILNPHGEQKEGIPFRLGDKIICLRNHWRLKDGHDRNDDLDDEKDLYIANGEIGRVVDWVRAKKSKTVTGVKAKFCGFTVSIEKGERGFQMFDPAYAVTCHKFQGAQSPVVIVIADESGDRVASRQGWYTAMTRAAKQLLTVGRMGTIIRQCQRVDLSARKTFLKEMLQESSVQPEFTEDELAEI